MHRLLFLSHTAAWGGAEKCLYLLLKGLPRDKYHPIVLLPASGALRTAISELGIETIEAPIAPIVGESWPRTAGSAQSFEQRATAIAQIVREQRIDLVISNTCVIAEGAFAARMCGIGHVWHVLEMLSQDPSLVSPLSLKSFYSMLGFLSEKVVAVSDSVKDEIEQYCAQCKVEVVHTGIEPVDLSGMDCRKEAVFDAPSDALIVTFAGILSKRKGVADLVRSAPAVLQKHPTARFMLVGTAGDDATAIKGLIQQLQLEESIRLCGFREDIPAVLSASDVVVMPSVADPLPLVVMEAMSLSRPVVGTKSGGCADMIVDGETGYLVPPQDPNALASAISDVLDDADRRQAMGHKAHQRFSSHFQHERYVRDFDRVLDEYAKSPVAVTEQSRASIRLLLSVLSEFEQEHRAGRQLRRDLTNAQNNLAMYDSHFLLGPVLRIRRKLRSLWRADSQLSGAEPLERSVDGKR